MYKLYIYNTSGHKVAYIKNLVPLDGTKVLEFSDYLSSYGNLKFRVQTKDPVLTTNILEPYKYEVKLYRNQKLVWAGPIVNNTKRNHQFIEVECKTYAWLMTKVQVVNATTEDNGYSYSDYKTGTMATAVTDAFNSGKGFSSSPIASFTIGEITNPNYPWEPATAWTFTDTIKMRFEYPSLFGFISSLANVSNADFTVSAEKVFNFKPVIGDSRHDVALVFGRGGNIADYDSPLGGETMANDIIVSSYNESGAKIINKSQQDSALFADYYRLWESQLYNEQISEQVLNERAKRSLAISKIPNAQIDLILNENALPFGTYNLGDYVLVNINDGVIDYDKERRIIGWKVAVYSNGVERATLVTSERF